MTTKTKIRRPSDDRLMTPVETAKLLGVREGTLALWRSDRNRDLPYIKIGHLVRYRLSDVEQWLDENTR